MELKATLFSNVWALFSVILFFGLSVFVHELGHFWAARRRGLIVKRFSIGFGPKLFSLTRNGTEYRIGLLPLGGYVLLPQLGDVRLLPESHTMKPVSYGTKMFVLSMGAFFNVLFAFFLATVLWGVGQPTTQPAQTTTLGYVAPEILLNEHTPPVAGPAFLAGLRPGDTVTRIDDQQVSDFSQIQQSIMTGSGRSKDGRPVAKLSVLREGRAFDVLVYPQLVEMNPSSKDSVRMTGMAPACRLIVGTVAPNSPAHRAGILPADEVVSLEGAPVYHIASLHAFLEKGQPMHLTLKRAQTLIEQSITPQYTAATRPSLVISFKDSQDKDGSLSFVAESQGSLTLVTQKGPAALPVELGETLLGYGRDVPTAVAILQKQLALGTSLVFSSPAGTSRLVDFGVKSKVSCVLPQKRPMLGITFTTPQVIVHVNPIDQFARQFKSIFQILSSLLSPKSDVHVNHLSGLPGMFRVLHHFSMIDLRLVLLFVLFLNLNLAILNLLPIPVLDGGHIVFETLAKLRGKPFPAHWVLGIQTSFMFLLFGFMLTVSVFDLKRWHGDHITEKQMAFRQRLFEEPVFTPE